MVSNNKNSKRGNSSKVISLTQKILDKNSTIGTTKTRKGASNMRVIAITSGKGGVGKTNIVANLGYSLSELGKKVLVFDADLGLGNLDVLFGIAPKYNLSHVISGEKGINDILVEGPGNIKILPASSGIQEITSLTIKQKSQLLNELELLIEPYDVLLIDTAAGISSNVMYFNVSAHEIMVVVTPEPTSITDAYALMKVLSVKYSEKHFKLMVNWVSNTEEAKRVFRQLSLVSERFLDIYIEYFGCILFDKNITKCVRIQKIVSEMYPESQASRCFVELAEKMCKTTPVSFKKGDNKLLWRRLLKDKLD